MDYLKEFECTKTKSEKEVIKQIIETKQLSLFSYDLK